MDGIQVFNLTPSSAKLLELRLKSTTRQWLHCCPKCELQTRAGDWTIPIGGPVIRHTKTQETLI